MRGGEWKEENRGEGEGKRQRDEGTKKKGETQPGRRERRNITDFYHGFCRKVCIAVIIKVTSC